MPHKAPFFNKKSLLILAFQAFTGKPSYALKLNRRVKVSTNAADFRRAKYEYLSDWA